MAESFEQRRAADIMEQLCNSKHASIEARMTKVEDSIVKLSSRLPTWATIVMTIMGTIIGNLLGRMAHV